MKKIIILFLISVLSKTIAGQTTYVLQPDAACGKDALVSSLTPNTNYGAHPDVLATAWTVSGIPVTGRTFLSFDFSGIPAGTTVVSATLDLFHYNDPYNVGHSNLSGPDDAGLYRVTQPWAENTVTWNTQPTYTFVNSLYIPAATTTTQNYSLNVATLVQDMINDPTHSFGFLFKENTESYYRSMLFASSDNADPALWPKLTLVLADSVDLSNICIVTPPAPAVTGSLPPEVNLLVPNVFTPDGNGENDTYYITCSGIKYFNMDIYNRWGEKVGKIDSNNLRWFGKDLNGADCSDGIYYYILNAEPQSGKAFKKQGFITLIR